MKPFVKLLFIIVIIHFFITDFQNLLFAGTTGKIVGNVTDAETGDALPGVNVVIEGTTMGAATDPEGGFIIVNVPPGNYNLVATMIGYQTQRMERVKVSIDLTSTIDFKLGTQALDLGEEVTVIAERPMVKKDLTATTAVVGADEMSTLPVTEVNDAIELQAGLVKDAGGGFHIRGGRSGEVSYWIDGIPVTDVYNGGSVVDVSKDMVQELQVVSGAFNAEYGQAMSGIINIATKSGDNDFGGSLTSYIGDHVSNHDKEFMNIKKFDPVAIRNFDGSIHGALMKDKLFYYLNSRYNYFDGWLDGQRRYNPGAIVAPYGDSRENIEKYAPDYLDESVVLDAEHDILGFGYVVGTSAYYDSILTWENMPTNLRDHADPDSAQYFFDKYYQALRENNKDGKGDGKYVPMNSSEKIYSQAKLIYKPTPSLTFAYNFIYDNVDYREWGIDNERNYKYNPDGAPKKNSLGITNIFKITHMLTPRTFYDLGISYFSKRYEKHTFDDIHDSRYVSPELGIQDAYSFKTGGTEDTYVDGNNPLFRPRFERETKTWVGKFDLTSQVTNTHQIKAGFEYRQHEVYRGDFSLNSALIADSTLKTTSPLFLGPYVTTSVAANTTIQTSEYNHKPIEFSAYLQDKMEFKQMIVNLGVRFDYFEPDGVVVTDPSDPSIYNPIKPANRYKDYGTDGIPNTHDADGTEGNNLQDPGEATVTLAERQSYWYKDATAKYQVSPRLGVSFPITDSGVIHFSYGHFFQIPRFERLYQNPDFELGYGTGNVGVIGNADLKPENTVSGEIGLQQQLSSSIFMSITGFFRDIRDLAGTRAEEIVLYGGSGKYSKIVNSDFGTVKGVIFALDKRFSGGLSASFDYTLQLAKGSNSDPEQARNALSGGSLPEVQLTPLDWDQRHTVNASVSYAGETWGGSVIGQIGSGLPYSPRRSEDITALLTNSQRRPMNHNVDLRLFKDLKYGNTTVTLFTKIFNVFDALNELTVYDDTGRAGFTTDQAQAEATNPSEIINTLNDWFLNPTYYSEPRRIEVGFTVTF